jgi:hypothetical protein
MDDETVLGLKYTKLSPETIEVGTVPIPDVIDAGYDARRVAKANLVWPRGPRLTTSLILTLITICIVGLPVELIQKRLWETPVIRNTLKFELLSRTRMTQLCPACAYSSSNAYYRILYACGYWLWDLQLLDKESTCCSHFVNPVLS